MGFRERYLREHFLNSVTVHICQAHVATIEVIGQFLVVQSE